MLAGFLRDFLAPLGIVAVVFVAVDRHQETRLVDFLTADRERLAAFGGVALVVTALTASTYALGSPPAIDGRYDLSFYHVALVVLVAGASMVAHGARHYDAATTFRAAEHVDPSDLPSTGVVAVTGTAEPVGAGTVPAPHTGTPSLVAEAGTFVGGERYVDAASGGRAHQLLEADRAGTSFDVTDDYGAVRVDPTGASLSFLTGETDGGVVERRVDPGQTVTVVGHAEPGRSVDPVAIVTPGNPNVDRFAVGIPRVLLLGPVVALAGFAGMLLTAGVL